VAKSGERFDFHRSPGGNKRCYEADDEKQAGDEEKNKNPARRFNGEKGISPETAIPVT
jgi:hypothetical protein